MGKRMVFNLIISFLVAVAFSIANPVASIAGGEEHAKEAIEHAEEAISHGESASGSSKKKY